MKYLSTFLLSIALILAHEENEASKSNSENVVWVTETQYTTLYPLQSNSSNVREYIVWFTETRTTTVHPDQKASSHVPAQSESAVLITETQTTTIEPSQSLSTLWVTMTSTTIVEAPAPEMATTIVWVTVITTQTYELYPSGPGTALYDHLVATQPKESENGASDGSKCGEKSHVSKSWEYEKQRTGDATNSTTELIPFERPGLHPPETEERNSNADVHIARRHFPNHTHPTISSPAISGNAFSKRDTSPPLFKYSSVPSSIWGQPIAPDEYHMWWCLGSPSSLSCEVEPTFTPIIQTDAEGLPSTLPTYVCSGNGYASELWCDIKRTDAAWISPRSITHLTPSELSIPTTTGGVNGRAESLATPTTTTQSHAPSWEWWRKSYFQDLESHGERRIVFIYEVWVAIIAALMIMSCMG